MQKGAMRLDVEAALQIYRAYGTYRLMISHELHNRVLSASQWLSVLESCEGARLLAPLYASELTALEKQDRLSRMVSEFIRRFGDSPVVIARAPGRLNIMGRHIDHQGGHVNMIALDRDTWVVAGLAATQNVTLVNLDTARFPDREFDSGDLLPDYRSQPWREYVDEPEILSRNRAANGDWSQYVKAPLARFLARYPRLEPTGLNLVVGGNVPPAAGLSSSSALVVSVMEALIGLTGYRVPDQEFVELCGEAEWYVGTRGGAGDHAAMKFARRGKVVQLRFFPLEVTDCVSFPPGHVMLVCNSGVSARKTLGAKDVFNQRVACYHMGRELFKQAFPEHAGRITHLRDMLPQNLGVAPATLLRMLDCLPERASRKDLMNLLPEDVLGPLLATHAESIGEYAIRGVVLFGLAECERSRAAAEYLREGREREFGQWMSVSHSGETSESDGPARDSVMSLASLPGFYGCSIPQIDHMARIVAPLEGVLGAQISGAGLGGCLMVLARSDAADSAARALVKEYYEPNGIPPEIFPCTPSAGSGILG